jgi:hypothetical protein
MCGIIGIHGTDAHYWETILAAVLDKLSHLR